MKPQLERHEWLGLRSSGGFSTLNTWAGMTQKSGSAAWGAPICTWLPPAWQLGSEWEHPDRKHFKRTRQKLQTCSDLASEVIQLHFCHMLLVTSEPQAVHAPGDGEGTPLLSREATRSDCRRAWREGASMVSIFGKHNLSHNCLVQL